MLNTLHSLAAPAVMGRLTLLLNHVLSSEPAATLRLRQHAGRCVRLHLTGWPGLLPPLPVFAFEITPAGMLEWVGGGSQADGGPAADLSVTLDASNPAMSLVKSLSGERPRVDVAGDALLAADASWLFDNLRWDVQDDLAKLIGPGPAHELSRLGARLSVALREGAAMLASLAARIRPDGSGSSTR